MKKDNWQFYFLIYYKSMSSKNVVVHKPLLEVTDFHGNKYYSEGTYEQMSFARQNQELIDFSFSGDCVKSSQIVRHRVADPEEVMMAWKTQQLGYWHKEALRAGIKLFQETFHYSKPLTEQRVDHMIDNIKKGKAAYSPNTNN